jgi:hypothetical protein
MKTTPILLIEFFVTGAFVEHSQDWKPILIQVVILILFQLLKLLTAYNKALKDKKNE